MFRVALLFAVLVLIGPGRPAADEMVTSDTIDYCNALVARMERQDMPPHVRVLLIEGRAMCARGHVMGGLRRIRLAMMFVHQAVSAP